VRKSFSPTRSIASPLKTLDKFRYFEFIKKKIDLCTEIYTLLAEISDKNHEIQINLYNLIPNFQIQAKYLPSANECITKIIGNNEFLLNNISKTVKFNFDFEEFGEKHDKFNILINIIDSKQKFTDKNEKKVIVSKQDKLTSKPMNLMNFYMNLIWDSKTIIKQDYLKFLQNLCKYEEKGVNINQEMIFKLYNCMVMAKKTNPLINARV